MLPPPAELCRSHPSAFNVFLFHHSEKDDFSLLQNRCKSSNFFVSQGKGTKEEITLFVSTTGFSSKKAFSASILFHFRGKKKKGIF